jgi:xylulokinase
VRKRDWSDLILAHAEVDAELLPAIHPSGTAVGRVTQSAAAETGLGAGVVVATGGHDQPCGALGAGIVRPGMAMNATGTSDVICPAMPEPVLSQSMLESNFCCYPHTCEDTFCSIGFNLTGGLLLRWYRDVLCVAEVAEATASGSDPYEVILAQMSTEPASAFFLPHFVGSGTPHLNPLSRGALLGLTLDTDKAQLTRAVIDSINYEMKLNIDRMEEAGIEITELRAIGGGAKSAKWMQMKADVFGKPVTSLETSEAASLGTAILAGKALGLFASTQEAADALVRTKTAYEPDARQHARYQALYQHYCKMHDLLREFNRELSNSSK